jgi:tetratricopeptide (TPR) repeat protein/signal recognition particle receptor subunit beta
VIRLNLHDTDVNLKIVIVGPERSGKTSIITYLTLNTKKQFRSPLTSYANPVGRTTFFDHLRIAFGMVGDRRLTVDLFTAPGSPSLVPRRKKILYLADGAIFTLDSSGQGKVNNLKAAAEFISWLRSDGIRPSRFPIVYLDHKDDVKNRSTLRIFKRLFSLSRAPLIHGSCYEGRGIWEALNAAVKVALSHKGKKLTRAFSIREDVPVTMREFEDIYKSYYLRKAAFEFDRQLSFGQRVFRVDPCSEDFLLTLSEAFERRGKLEKAQKYRQWASRQRNPENPGTAIRIIDAESKNPINTFERSRYLTAARLFIEQGHGERAQKAVRAAVAGEEDLFSHLMLMKRLAEMKLNAGRQEEALNSFSRIANRFAAAGYNRQALCLFHRVLSIRPRSLECLLGTANTLEALERNVDALGYFRLVQQIMNEGKIVVGKADVQRRIDAISKRIVDAREEGDIIMDLNPSKDPL